MISEIRSVTGTVPAVTAIFDGDYVIASLETAGKTLLSLPHEGHGTHLRTGGLDYVNAAIEAYGWTDLPVRPARPSGREIDRMDEVLGWIALIPNERYVLRRIVGTRALVSPVTDRHLFHWRKIAKMLGCDRRALARWHAEGINLIVRGLIEN